MNVELPPDLRDEIAHIIEAAEVTEGTADLADETFALHEDIRTVPPSKEEYPCPTCGRQFSIIEECDAHAANCEGAADRPLKDSAAGWPRSRVLQLLKAMRQRFSRFEEMTPKERRAHWRRVGVTLGVTGDSARRRWHSLVNGYTRAKSMSMQGRRRAAQQWPYYNEMEQIVHNPYSDEVEFVVSSVIQRCAASESGGRTDPELLLNPQDDPDTDGSNDTLISFMEKQFRQFDRCTSDMKKDLWQDIAKQLKLTTEEVRVRWSLLTGTFRRMKAQSDPARHRWKYFSRIERILSRSGGQPERPEPLLTLPGQRPLIPPVPVEVFNAVCGPPPPEIPQTETSSSPAAASAKADSTSTTKSSGEHSQDQQQSIKERLQEVDLVLEKRRTLCVEDYLRAKLKREQIRLEVEERRVKALERIANALDAS